MMQAIETPSTNTALLGDKPKPGLLGFLQRHQLPIHSAFWSVAYISSSIQYRDKLGTSGGLWHLGATAIGLIGAAGLTIYHLTSKFRPHLEKNDLSSAWNYTSDVFRKMFTPPVNYFPNVDLRRFFVCSYMLADTCAIAAYGLLNNVKAGDIAYQAGATLLETTILAGTPNRHLAYVGFGLVVGIPQMIPLISEITSPTGRVPFLITNIAIVTGCALLTATSAPALVETLKKASGWKDKVASVIVGNDVQMQR